MKISWSWASSLEGSIPWILPLAWRKARDLISSSDNLSVDVMIGAIPRNHPICACLNQFCSSLSTSTSMSLMLNSSDLLLALETFNTENLFYFYFLWGQNIFCIRSTNTKKVHVYAHNFSVSVVSSSGTHQSHHLDGCQAMGEALPSFLLFEPSRSYNHRTTQ